ncbi:MAG: TniB family NTP-binding protein [Burkholderiaceae bacterium]|jgi:energy-coupling factor transporter ATP-binding protein EcfA2|nr:TniB family NTP-binding protein [Burkholderiaceae bacterium]
MNRTKWLGRTLAVRLVDFNKIYVVHEAVGRVVAHIKRELILCEAKGRASGILVIGASGAGKTSLIAYIKRIYPDQVSPTLTCRPVVSFSIPAMPSPNSMGAALLGALGDPLPTKGNALEKMNRAAILLNTVGTKIVAIDNFQDVPTRRKARGVEQIASWLRDLCDLPFPGVVMAFGTKDAAAVRDAHKELLRRMQARLELPLFALDTPKQAAAFKRLLNLIDESLPLAEQSGLSSRALAARLYRATNGNLDYLIKLLEKALVCAVARGAERIEMGDLEAAFLQQHQVAAEGGNPFSEDYDGKELREPGQIFGPSMVPKSDRFGLTQGQKAGK